MFPPPNTFVCSPLPSGGSPGSAPAFPTIFGTIGSYEAFQPFASSLWLPSTASYLFRQMLIRSFDGASIPSEARSFAVRWNHSRFMQEETGRFSQVPGESF